MTAQKWQAVKDLFDKCLNAPPELRAQMLSDSAVDQDIRAEAARLLGNLDDAHESFLRPPEAFRRAILSRESLRQGDMLAGRFRVERFVGRGGMGEVYEATDMDLNERVAVKMLAPELEEDSGGSARIRRELQVARRVTHPNVCRLFDLSRHRFEWGEVEFLSMEFLEGETLAARIKSAGPLPPSQALPVLKQVTEGLEAVHQAGVIHRDLKPSNIMLQSSSGRVVVMDFGLARRFARSEVSVTETGQIAGTLDYMAPELFTGGTASVASDVFALGKVALVTLTASFNIADGRLPAAWKSALERALHPDPAQRFQKASDFIAALENLPETVTWKTPAVRPRTRMIAAMAAAVILVIALAWWMWGRGSRQPPAEAQRLYQTGIEQIRAGSYYAATRALDRAVSLAPRYALAHARLAEAWTELQIYEKATREMLLARREDLSSLSDLDRLQIEAIDLTVTREYAGAASRYEQLRAKGGEKFDLDVARAYEKTNRQEDAFQIYSRVTRANPGSAAAWLRMGSLTGARGNAAQAAEAFARAEQIYQAENNLEGLIEVAFRRGADASRHSDFEGAKAHFQRSRETARLAGNTQQEISAALQLATVAYMQGDVPLSQQFAHDGLQIARSNQMESLAIVGLVALGSASQRKRDFDASEQYYKEALAMARRENAYRQEALCLLTLASLHSQQRRGAEMEQEVRQALNFYKPNGYFYEAARGLILLGRYQRDQGQAAVALSTFEEAVALAEKAKDGSTISLANSALAKLLDVQERLPEALTAYRRGLEIPSDEETTAYANLQTAGVLSRLGQFGEAAQLLDRMDKASQKFPTMRMQASEARGWMALRQQQTAEAIRIARQGLTEAGGKNTFDVAQFQKLLGLALVEDGKISEGGRLCEDALKAAAKVADKNALLDAQMNAMQCRVLQSNARGANVLFAQIEPTLGDRPESKWRALAWVAQVNPKYAAPARSALEDLKRLWGEPAWSGYISRPDLQKLSMSLLNGSSR